MPLLKRGFNLFLFTIITLGLVISCVSKDGKEEKIGLFKNETPKKYDPLDSLKQEILKAPNKAKNYFRRAEVLLEKGETERSLGDLNRAILLDSQNVNYHYKKAEINYINGRSDEALKGFEKCLELDPEHVLSMLKLAKIYFVFKHYDKAMKFINNALKTNKYLPEAYYLKGFVFKEIGDTTKAISSFQTAREVDPDFYDAALHLGLIYAKKKNRNALDFYDDALRINPKSKEALYNKGLFYQNSGDFKAALECYEEIMDLDSLYSLAYYNRGFIYLVYKDKLKESIKDFSMVIKIDEEHFQAIYNRGYANELLGNSSLAEEDYRKALEIKPSYDLAAKGLTRLGL